jgi:2-hydroxychromene-2-carboxylate isomerase
VTPIGNRVVAAILRSPLHRVVSGGVGLVRYTAPRSGRVVTTPVQYADHGDGEVILVAHPDDKTWWRAFRTEHPVDLLVRGRWLHLRGRAVATAAEPDVAAPLAQAYRQRFPKAATAMGDHPLLVWCRPPGQTASTVIEVFADVVCPFTHLGLRRFVEARAERGREDVVLWVRAWPLELVNGEPLAAGFVAEEVDDLRVQVAPDAFVGFTEATFPATSLPALELAAAAYRLGMAVGEAVSLELRDQLFEHGADLGDPSVLARVAAVHGVPYPVDAMPAVLADHAEGVERGVLGSPHYFTLAGGFFCPALDVHRDAAGHLHVTADPVAFDRFLDTCFD